MDRASLGTPAQVAEHLQVPEKTLAEWRSRGIGPEYRKVGRYVRYVWKDVDVWLDAQRCGGTAA
ncbi:helix-turn-helix domain-containing protein [Actinoallomurus oryzae]